MRQRARRRIPAERRALILEGAQDVFATAGYARAGTSELAEAAGVSAAALYRYFPSKKDLYLAVLQAAGPRLLQIWDRLAEQAGDPLAFLWSAGLGYYDRMNSRAPITTLWFQALAEADDPAVRSAVAETYTGAVDLLERALEGGKATGRVRPEINSRIAAWHFMAIGLSFELIHLLQLDSELDRSKVEDWGRLYLDSVRQGEHANDS